jgi:hypothetical protein
MTTLKAREEGRRCSGRPVTNTRREQRSTVERDLPLDVRRRDPPADPRLVRETRLCRPALRSDRAAASLGSAVCRARRFRLPAARPQ